MAKLDEKLKELLEQYGYEYLSEHGDSDACPCEMDMLEEYTNFTPMEAIRRAFYGYRYNPYWDGKDEHLEEFNPNDDYFAFNGYANLVSISFFSLPIGSQIIST